MFSEMKDLFFIDDKNNSGGLGTKEYIIFENHGNWGWGMHCAEI